MPDYIKIKIRRGSTEDWEASNPVLELGEIGADTTKHLLKVGNGSSAWKVLPYYAVDVVDDLTSGGTDKALSAEQGRELKELVDGKADSSDLTTLETTLRELISSNSVYIEDSFASTSRNDALSARCGKVLWDAIAALPTSAGQPGQAATIEILSTSTGEPGTDTKVENVGTTSAVKLKFTIPRGDKGDKGDTGSGGSGSSVGLVNDLTTGGTDKALTAEQGKVIGDKIKGMGIFGMGYTVDEFNAYDKPTKITFEDGVTCTLNWIGGTILRNIVASTGEVITMNYDNYGKIIGRTITR